MYGFKIKRYAFMQGKDFLQGHVVIGQGVMALN